MSDPIEQLATTVSITNGRVTMSAEGPADLSVETPSESPLPANESPTTLHLAGEGYQVTVELDAHQVRALLAMLADNDDDGHTAASAQREEFADWNTGWMKTIVGGVLHWQCLGCSRTIRADRDLRELTHADSCPDAGHDRSPPSKGGR